jgi:hypothetical protein
MAGSKKDGESMEATAAAAAAKGGDGTRASRSPPRTPAERTRSRGRSLVWRRGDNEIVVHERVIQSGGGGGHMVYPTLTSTNYIECDED